MATNTYTSTYFTPYASPYLSASYEDAQKRDQEIMVGYQQRYDQAMASLAGWGPQQRKDLAAHYRSAENRGMMDLLNQGLTGTTIAPSMRAGYARQYQDALNRLNESLTAQTLGYQTGLSGDKLAYMGQSMARYASPMDLATAQLQQQHLANQQLQTALLGGRTQYVGPAQYASPTAPAGGYAFTGAAQSLPGTYGSPTFTEWYNRQF